MDQDLAEEGSYNRTKNPQQPERKWGFSWIEIYGMIVSKRTKEGGM